MFHAGCAEFCKGLDCEIKNSGDKVTVSITGEKEKLSLVEKKLKALKTLCGDGGGCC